MKFEPRPEPLAAVPLTVFDEVIRVWDPWIGDYYERMDPKAFNKTLKERSPIMLWNHGADV